MIHFPDQFILLFLFLTALLVNLIDGLSCREKKSVRSKRVGGIRFQLNLNK